MRIFAAILLALAGFDASAKSCATLGDKLARDEPRVKAALHSLTPQDYLAGISLCDGTVILRGWRFLRAAKIQGPYQHILLFREGGTLRAVAWVDATGKPFLVPPCPFGKRCDELSEAATIISGDVYTYRAVRPGGELVIIQYPPSIW